MKSTNLRIGALAFVVVACGGSGTVVATVDGTEITASDVEALYSADVGAVPEEQFADNLLNTIVEFLVIDRAESEFGITFDDAEIEVRRQEIEDTIAAQSPDVSYEDFLETNGFTNERIFRIAHQQLVAEAVEVGLIAEAGDIDEEAIQERYDARLFELTEACVSHILVETEEEALDAKARIEAGESFADVAADVGTDGTAPNGGELGCSSLGQYVPEFALGAYEVPLNETSQPVKSQFGYHLILVTERTTTPLEEVEADIRTSLESERGGSLVQDWLLEIVTAAEVSIVEEYGTWVISPFPDVQPPA